MTEFAALLSVSSLFGGMVLYSFGFAPMVFSTLPSEDAGRLLRAAFPWYYLYVTAFAVLGGGVMLLRDAASGWLLIAIAAAALFARQVLMPLINAARDSQLAGDGSAKQRFARLHGITVGLNLVQLAATGYVLYRFTG